MSQAATTMPYHGVHGTTASTYLPDAMGGVSAASVPVFLWVSALIVAVIIGMLLWYSSSQPNKPVARLLALESTMDFEYNALMSRHGHRRNAGLDPAGVGGSRPMPTDWQRDVVTALSSATFEAEGVIQTPERASALECAESVKRAVTVGLQPLGKRRVEAPPAVHQHGKVSDVIERSLAKRPTPSVGEAKYTAQSASAVAGLLELFFDTDSTSKLVKQAGGVHQGVSTEQLYDRDTRSARGFVGTMNMDHSAATVAAYLRDPSMRPSWDVLLQSEEVLSEQRGLTVVHRTYRGFGPVGAHDFVVAQGEQEVPLGNGKIANLLFSYSVSPASTAGSQSPKPARGSVQFSGLIVRPDDAIAQKCTVQYAACFSLPDVPQLFVELLAARRPLVLAIIDAHLCDKTPTALPDSANELPVGGCTATR